VRASRRTYYQDHLGIGNVRAESAELLQALRRARDVVDADNPAESFGRVSRRRLPRGCKTSSLVTQICYRAADLAYLLKREGKALSRYSHHLRREPGVDDDED
jgi:hypothetical protein